MRFKFFGWNCNNLLFYNLKKNVACDFFFFLQNVNFDEWGGKKRHTCIACVLTFFLTTDKYFFFFCRLVNLILSQSYLFVSLFCFYFANITSEDLTSPSLFIRAFDKFCRFVVFFLLLQKVNSSLVFPHILDFIYILFGNTHMARTRMLSDFKISLLTILFKWQFMKHAFYFIVLW